MTEQQFLMELENALNRLPNEERQDILQDIREYFLNARQDGKTDEKIAAELGNPVDIAAELISSFDFSNMESPVATVDLSKDKFDKVDIQIDHGALDIRSSLDGQMHVDVKDKGYKQQLTVDIIDRTLVIKLEEEISKWGIFSFTINTKSPIVTVQLPQKVYELIKIYTDNGKIIGSQLESTIFSAESDNGRIQLEYISATEFITESDNGSVRLTSIQAEHLAATSDNGKIELEEAKTKNVRLKSDNGSITMDNVEGNIQAETDNGKISLKTQHIERDITLKSDNGSITIETITPPQNVTIRAQRDGGQASIFEKKSKQTVYGTGQHSIVLKTDNGSITVKQV